MSNPYDELKNNEQRFNLDMSSEVQPSLDDAEPVVPSDEMMPEGDELLQNEYHGELNRLVKVETHIIQSKTADMPADAKLDTTITTVSTQQAQDLSFKSALDSVVESPIAKEAIAMAAPAAVNAGANNVGANIAVANNAGANNVPPPAQDLNIQYGDVLNNLAGQPQNEQEQEEAEVVQEQAPANQGGGLFGFLQGLNPFANNGGNQEQPAVEGADDEIDNDARQLGFLDGVSLEVMQDPVFAHDDLHAFDRATLNQLIDAGQPCPTCRAPINAGTLSDAVDLGAEIQRYVEDPAGYLAEVQNEGNEQVEVDGDLLPPPPPPPPFDADALLGDMDDMPNELNAEDQGGEDLPPPVPARDDLDVDAQGELQEDQDQVDELVQNYGNILAVLGNNAPQGDQVEVEQAGVMGEPQEGQPINPADVLGGNGDIPNLGDAAPENHIADAYNAVLDDIAAFNPPQDHVVENQPADIL